MLDKVSIAGAGQVGSNLAFLLLYKRLCKQILLLDIQQDLAKAVALDLEDARYSFGSNQKLTASSNLKDLSASDIIVISAGKPRSPGMSRQDLIRINSLVIKKITSHIKKTAKNAIVIVVTNPLDLMVYLTLKKTGFSWKRVMGMGSSLDSSRFANLISKKINVGIEDINPVVLGAHGKEMLVSSTTNIRGARLTTFLDAKKINELKTKTVTRGTQIVKLLKLGSARFGPAAACLNMLEAIACNKKAVTFASVYLNGQYGLKGVCLGVPVILGSRGIEKILEFNLPKKELRLLRTAETSFKKSLKSL